jgi:hypothetical protein
MSSASPKDSSNDLLTLNTAASNSSPNDHDLEKNEIPMNLLPAGN